MYHLAQDLLVIANAIIERLREVDSPFVDFSGTGTARQDQGQALAGRPPTSAFSHCSV